MVLNVEFECSLQNQTISVPPVSASPSPSSSPASSPGTKHKSNTGAIVGGVIGGIVGLVLAVFFLALVERDHLAETDHVLSKIFKNGGAVAQDGVCGEEGTVGGEVDAEGAEGPECGDGTGEGYARYELSADGERAATANVHRKSEVWMAFSNERPHLLDWVTSRGHAAASYWRCHRYRFHFRAR